MYMVDFKTYGLFGEKISKALLPQVFNSIFDVLGIPAVYMPFPASKDRFLTALPVLRADFAGFNVTMPFRRDIIAHLDRLDASVKQVDSVNTVKVDNGKMVGYNTDMVGFERSLIGFMGNMYDKDVLLVGSGGAAHAVAHVLLEKGAFLTILSRNAAHAYDLKDLLHKTYNKNRIKVLKGLSYADAFFAVFNTAAIDLESKQSEISIHSQNYNSFQYAYDVSYRQTAFLKKAEDFGAKTKDGFDMLFYQAIRALEIWLGKDTGMDVSTIASTYDQVKAQYNAVLF